MPELPEVEVLVRHLAPLLQGRRIAAVAVHKARVVRPHRGADLDADLRDATILRVRRRAKYLVFDLWRADGDRMLLGHLGMTGRMFLQPAAAPVPRHAAVTFDLGTDRWIFEDPRGFGRMTLDGSALDQLGPEPWDAGFNPATFRSALGTSRQAIKVRLLDQSLVAGVGNIYASEALHRAGISPRRRARRLTLLEATALHAAIREVLDDAIRVGSTLPLDFAGAADGGGDGLFYYGSAPAEPRSGAERLRVYDRAGLACLRCGTLIRRIVQAARSTFFCPACQR